MSIKFRPLEADEIKCRVAQCGKAGVKLLLYKDARCDMDILDETVGNENWQDEYYEAKGILFCRIGINIGARMDCLTEWIWKADAGAESNMEADKGNASDALKRAGFRWGIGRALYTAPEIFIYETDSKGKKNAVIGTSKDGKPACYDKFSVEKIKYSDDGKRIIGLAIRNESLNKRVFVWQAK